MNADPYATAGTALVLLSLAMFAPTWIRGALARWLRGLRWPAQRR